MTDNGLDIGGSSTCSAANDVFIHARTLARQQQWALLLAFATEANRSLRDPYLEYWLVRWRHQAAKAIAVAATPASLSRGDGVAAFPGVPEVSALDFSPETLADALAARGMLVVRGLVDLDTAQRFAEGIDRALAAAAAADGGASLPATLPWFGPLRVGHANQELARIRWIGRQSSSVLTADSPRMLFDLVDTFDSMGLIDIIERYMGERPLLSAQKGVLRRVSAHRRRNQDGDWHQDGAFLGSDIRALNVWLALSECGDDAPGLDIVARRLDRVVETGTGGAKFSWSVGPAAVAALCRDRDIASPRFAPGDAVLFDHLCLHRTSARPQMTRTRWAIESWFFAPSTRPHQYFPLVV